MEITEQMYQLAKRVVDEYENNGKISLAEVLFSGKIPAKEKLELRETKKEIGGVYYWKRTGWTPEFSGMIKIKSEGGSSRVKGWQVVYILDELKKLANRHCGLAEETYCTIFADDDELFEVFIKN